VPALIPEIICNSLKLEKRPFLVLSSMISFALSLILGILDSSSTEAEFKSKGIIALD